MKKTTMKLVMLLVILLVSTNSMVLAKEDNSSNAKISYATNSNGAISANVAVTDEENANVAVTEENIADEIVVNETENVVITKTPMPTKQAAPIPVDTRKSPGFESIASAIVILSAIYVIRRK